ncbi:hypothetical protein M2651_07960 [Clostridium sp. SYSU_GA19001]|uniref:hypothetical protein n=1 Tax=Clostridium caldaquaticum TaxID=2940653 RepID=UPI002076DA0B|nr:hypothetical protein [Clostridium caldaquaticum]MCM8710959.1 hypothetical protein [Clostridium caldaquaticum]
MEYRLNKIDTDLRQKINESTKEGKVHGTKNISINKDKKEEKKEKKDYSLKRYKATQKFSVEAVKTVVQNSSKGSFIDVKK